jgi:hypothetical protein
MSVDGLVPWPLCECECGCGEMLTSDEEENDGICSDCADGMCEV